MCLFSKLLERSRFLWPSVADGTVTISSAQLGYLLDGIDWRAPQTTWRHAPRDSTGQAVHSTGGGSKANAIVNTPAESLPKDLAAAHAMILAERAARDVEQDLDGQIARLTAEGCTVVRSEKVSGASREGRLELAIVLQFLRAGDELVVTRLDRLGRDTRDVLNLIYECEKRGASVTVLDPHVSTRGDMGHVVLTVLGMVAQTERRFIKERQREGIERAKAEGRYVGGRRRIDRADIAAMRAAGETSFRSQSRSGAAACRSTGSSGSLNSLKHVEECRAPRRQKLQRSVRNPTATSAKIYGAPSIDRISNRPCAVVRLCSSRSMSA